jgi:hypothetical protein
MRAQFVFEKFEEESDPIHDLGIGTPLGIAGGYLQKYADEHGYDFQIVPIRKQESPIIFVDCEPFFEVLTGNQGGAAVYVYKYKFTITYMPHQAPNIYSLRKEWVGYPFNFSRKEADEITDMWRKYPNRRENYEELKLKKLKENIKSGNVKERDVKQNLMGRFRKDQLPDLIARIDKNLKSDKRIK